MLYKRIVSKTVRNEEGVKKFTGVNEFEPVQLSGSAEKRRHPTVFLNFGLIKRSIDVVIGNYHEQQPSGRKRLKISFWFSIRI